MGERQKDRLERFPRALVVSYAVVLATVLTFHVLLSLLRTTQQGSPGLALLGFAVLAAYGVWLSLDAQRQAEAEAQAKGMGPRDTVAAGLYIGVGIGNFLGISGLMATTSLGWAWGALFYGIYVLHGAYLLLRWRRYMETPAGAG